MPRWVKKYKFLTLEERLSIFEHREKNPKDSFEKIAKIFSEKLEKHITRVTVYKTCTRIKEKNSKRLQVVGSQKMTLTWHKKVLPQEMKQGLMK